MTQPLLITDSQLGLLLRLYDRPLALAALPQSSGLVTDLDHLSAIGLTVLDGGQSAAITQAGADHIHALLDPRSGPLLQHLQPSSRT